MSYYSQTQANPGNEDSSTNSSPIDYEQEDLGYTVRRVRPFVPEHEPSDPQTEPLSGADETELDPQVEERLMHQNFRTLSSA